MIFGPALPALHAQEVRDVPFTQVCNFANSPRFYNSGTVQIKTANGETVEGVCFSVDLNEIQLNTKNGIVKIARAQLAHVSMIEVPKGHQLRILGKHVGRGISNSAKMIPTEGGIAGVIGVPATLAYGAVAVPFCLLGDLIGYTKTVEIRIR